MVLRGLENSKKYVPALPDDAKGLSSTTKPVRKKFAHQNVSKRNQSSSKQLQTIERLSFNRHDCHKAHILLPWYI